MILFSREGNLDFGILTLRDYWERFSSSLYVWTIDDYCEHWLSVAVSALEGRDVSFITEWNGRVEDSPELDGSEADEYYYGSEWVLYWVNDQKAVLQNYLIVEDSSLDDPRDRDLPTKPNPSEVERVPSKWIVYREELVQYVCEMNEFLQARKDSGEYRRRAP